MFVYDCSMSFHYLIKRYYSNRFHIESYSDSHTFLLDNLENFEAAFFMINTRVDFLFFTKVYTHFKNLFVITSVKLFEHEINGININNIVMLDFNDDLNTTILNEIDFQLKLKKLI